MKQLTLQERKEYIQAALIYFDIPKYKFAFELCRDQHCSIRYYFTKHLDKNYISSLLRMKKDITQIKSDEGMKDTWLIKFKGILAACFEGDLPPATLDGILRNLSEDEQIFYTTSDCNGTSPIALAAENHNIEVLLKLESIYQNLLTKHPDRYKKAHFQLYIGLRNFKYTPNLNNAELESYIFLINLSFKIATVKSPQGLNETRNKQFNFGIDGAYVDGNKRTPLLHVFSLLLTSFYLHSNLEAVKLLCTCLAQKLTPSEFAEILGAVQIAKNIDSDILTAAELKHNEDNEAFHLARNTIIKLPPNLVNGLKTGNSVLSLNEDQIIDESTFLIEPKPHKKNQYHLLQSFFTFKQSSHYKTLEQEPTESKRLSCFNLC